MEPELRILIIDDDEVDRMTIRRSVKKAGIQATMHDAESIDDAWQQVLTHEYDCIFLDYRLPGGDGLELLQEFRAKGLNMPVIVVTSQGDEKVAVEVMKSGGSDYLSKRLLNPEGVSQILRNAIRTHKAEAERLRTATELEASQARLSEAQRIANIGSWEIDLVTGKRYWSDQVYRILRYPDFQPINQRDFEQLIHPEDKERAIAFFRGCVIHGQDFRFDMRAITHTGEVRHMEIQGRRIKDEAGRTAKVVGTIQDIHQRKKIERELIEARDSAERSAKAKEEFLANMSHEIRTPMNAIIGFTKLLYDSPLNAEQKEALKAIDSSGEALMAIINDILDLSKIEAGKLSFEEKPFSISELLQSLSGIFRARADEKQLQLSYFLGPEVPDAIIGDKVRLNQVLINLVGNAIKFTDKGEINISVKLIDRTNSHAHLLFEVNDTGIGIPQAKQKSIFESFTQASNETTRKFGGTGLGLTICKRIVELQGGRIGVLSTPGEGSTFFFDLNYPVASETVASPSQPAVQPVWQIAPANIRVLLAEDNRMNQRLASKVLDKLGYPFAIANNGIEALEKLEQAPFDIVLMDIQMPELDGYGAARRIRQHANPRISNLPMIALTAHALTEEVDRCMAAGMNAFISKPFDPKNLQAKIQQLVTSSSEEVASRETMVVPTPQERNYQFIDLKAVEELADGQAEFKVELIDIFLEESPLAMQKVDMGLAEGNGEAIYQSIHAVKPSFVLFRVKEHAALIPEIERLAKAGAQHLAELPPLLARLKANLAGAEKEMAAEKAHLMAFNA